MLYACPASDPSISHSQQKQDPGTPDQVLTDGFDFPVGDPDGKGSYISQLDQKKYQGWKVSLGLGDQFRFGLHTGEDWNGSGGGNTDLGQPVYAIGKGLVLEAEDMGAPIGQVALIRHQYLQGDSVQTVFSAYAHLKDLFVQKGDTVDRRQSIGSIGNGGGDFFQAHLHLEIRKGNMKAYPLLYWPSLDGKDLPWIVEHYHPPGAFISAHRRID